MLAGDYPSRVARSKMDMNVRMPDSLPVGLPSTLLQRRPDVRQAEQNLKAAMASAGMAYADRFPRLTISLTGGLENDALKGLINSPFSYAAGNLTAPLFASDRSVRNTARRWRPTTRRGWPTNRKCWRFSAK